MDHKQSPAEFGDQSQPIITELKPLYSHCALDDYDFINQVSQLCLCLYIFLTNTEAHLDILSQILRVKKRHLSK